jgi:translocation and assembly module TamB
MSRRVRVSLIAAGSFIALLAIAVVAVIAIGNSDWLREKFRQRIIAEATAATGGRMELGAFKLDWRTLTAELDNVVLHGKEPPGATPFLTIKRLVIGFRILSLAEKTFDVARLEAENPQAHLILQADGSTNLPEPPPPHHDIPKMILDLRIGKFNLTDGVVLTEQAGSKTVTAWNAQGEKLASQASYNRPNKRYDGEVSIAALNLAWDGFGKVTGQFTARASMEVNRVTVSSAALKTGDSELDVSDVVVSSFTAPVMTGQYKARISLRDADRIFKLVDFQHTGTVTATGAIRYVSPKDYSVSGAVRGVGIGYGKIPDIRVSGNITATPDKLLLSGLRLAALGGEIAASGTVRKFEDVHLTGEFQHFDAAALAGVAGMAPLPWDGVVSGPFDLAGKLSESDFHRVVASTTLAVSPAERGEPLRGVVSVKYDEPAGTIEFGNSWLELPKTRVDLTGVLGQRLDVKLQTEDLGELKPLLGSVSLPFRLENGALGTGSVAANGSVTGALADPRIAGHAAIQNMIYEKQHIDSLAGDFTAMKSAVSVANAALVASNLRARVTGSIGLTDWKVTDASAVNGSVQLTNADIPQLLALAGEKDFPATGTLNTTAQVTGTVGDPRISADLRVTRGQLYGEPYDLVTGRAQYVNGGEQLVTAVLDAGRKRVNVTARYDHTANTFTTGKLTFNVSSNAMVLSQIASVKQREPDLSGTLQIKADGAIEIKSSGVDVLDLNADLTATGLMLGVRNFGDAHVTAQTKNDVMTVRLDSDAARAVIRGEGTVRLQGDYPVDAKLTFSNVGLNALAAALMPENKQQNFDGSVAGDVTLRGPVKTPDLITATFEIPQFEVHPLAVTGDAKNIPNLALKNTGPIRATLERSTIRFESAHFQAPSTDLDLSGTVSLKDSSPLNLRVKGSVNLALAETVSPDLSSAGDLVINAAVRGSYTSPDLSGTAELQKGNFHYAEFTNGLTNASAVIAFNGTRATIQSFRGESGGGKVDATGFAALTNGLIAFRLEAKTRAVRVRYPEGVSTVSDADLTLSGTSQRSEVSGTVTIRRIAINPRSDLSKTILESAALPLKTPEAGSGMLGNMNLDVQIETAPDVAFEASVAQSIEADANLRLRGTPINPAVLGRINVTQGQLVFLGNKYTINQGSISFFNPAKIDPVLNVDLETKARGVDVTLTINGPIAKLNMSARSDPPLQWADIVALLATGRTPTDPTLAIRNTGQSSSLQQMGAQALIGSAISNPVGGNLQRFFGVSRIKIDPQLVGVTGSPEARLTIEQQVTPDLLFTYISDVSSTSTQLIQVRWDFNRKWSAILTREENGYVGVDFAYKKRFK